MKDGETRVGSKRLEEGDGVYTGGDVGCRGGGRSNTFSKLRVLSGMLGFQSFKTSGLESGLSNSSVRPRAPSCSAAHLFSPQSPPNPFVAFANNSTSNGRSCFEGCKK